MSFERLDKDKDADENVDAGQISTVRLVRGQSIGLFTQREEINIDFRVSGLAHAVVKQAENFRVRELLKKIESRPHRRALQAVFKQNNTYNPFSEESKSDDSWHGQRRSCSRCAKQFRRCNAQNAFFIGMKELSIALLVISWKKVKPANIFINGDWTLSESRTTLSRRDDFEVLCSAELKHRKSMS